MANFVEEEVYPVNVHVIGTDELVQGGDGGPTNVPTQQLVNRTKWLKKQVTDILEAITGITNKNPENLITRKFNIGAWNMVSGGLYKVITLSSLSIDRAKIVGYQAFILSDDITTDEIVSVPLSADGHIEVINEIEMISTEPSFRLHHGALFANARYSGAVNRGYIIVTLIP